jgi:hypothetical protein
MSRKPIYSKTVPYRIISMPNELWQLQMKTAETKGTNAVKPNKHYPDGLPHFDPWQQYARSTDLETAKGQLAAQEAKGSNQQMS